MRRPANLPALLPSRGLLVSALLHAALLALLISLPAPPPMAPVVEHVIDVEIVSAPPATPEARPGIVAPSPATPPPPPVPMTPAPPIQPGMVQAKALFSAATLADPDSLKALASMAPNERVEQLCGAEAMQQLHAWLGDFEPDWLIAYALAPTHFSGGTLEADGAAFHSRRQWYRLKFSCTLAPDDAKVTAFEFLVGDMLPRREWAAHNLPSLN